MWSNVDEIQVSILGFDRKCDENMPSNDVIIINVIIEVKPKFNLIFVIKRYFKHKILIISLKMLISFIIKFPIYE